MSAARPGSPGWEFGALLRQTPVGASEVEIFLDSLGHEERVEAIRAAGRREQARLYEAVGGVAPLTLAELVPPPVEDLATVRHVGRNSLPAFSSFEKRFCRPRGSDPLGPESLWGFNHQRLTPRLIGPGYFVAREDPVQGEVLVDYREIPPDRPPDWPKLRPNDRGFARLVFGFLVDTLRRVSDHVTIGSAARGGKDMGSWFLLCREP